MPNASSCACKSCGPSCKCGAQTPKAGECCCGPVCTCGPTCDCPASCGCQARREEAKRLGGGELIRLGVLVDSLVKCAGAMRGSCLRALAPRTWPSFGVAPPLVPTPRTSLNSRARKAMREALRNHCGVDRLGSCHCGCEADGAV